MFLEHLSNPANDPTKSNLAIFLTRNNKNTSNGKRFDINRIELEKEPFIKLEQIISYDEKNHILEISNRLRNKLLKIEYPSTGLAFVITINSKPVFGGHFWPSHSSLSCNTVAIDPFDLYYSNKLYLKLGYPGIDSFSGTDPRNNRLILNTFKQVRKLKKLKEITKV